MSNRTPFEPPYTAEDLGQLDALHDAVGLGEDWRASERRGEVAEIWREGHTVLAGTSTLPPPPQRGGLIAILGRAAGKRARFQENVRAAEARGEWVVIASTRGAHCSRCQREADICRGTCMNESERDR